MHPFDLITAGRRGLKVFLLYWIEETGTLRTTRRIERLFFYLLGKHYFNHTPHRTNFTPYQYFPGISNQIRRSGV